MKEFNFIQAVDVILRYNQNNFVEDDYYIKWSNSPVYKLNKSQIYNIACPDIYGSEIENGIVEKIWFDEIKRCNNKKNLNTDRNRNYKTNAVILESPHKTEYENHCFINPALGSTGKKLQQLFPNLVKKMASSGLCSDIKNGKYRFILMESIQHQCSLGIEPINHEIRDLIFSGIWEREDIKNDFLIRLSSYNPDIILNLCTKGEKAKPELRILVHNLINKYQKSNTLVKLYRGSHPSSWKGKPDKENTSRYIQKAEDDKSKKYF